MRNNIERFEIGLEFLNKIPKECHPRIGGSCALWVMGLSDGFNDIDIVCDFIPNMNMSSKLENVHSKRLNDTVAYDFIGERIELHESLMPRRGNGILEDVDNIRYSRKLIGRFLKEVYGCETNKWDKSYGMVCGRQE